MGERRVRYADDKLDLIDRLVGEGKYKDSASPFTTRADVIAFAAAYGAKRNRFEPIVGKTAEPIRWDVFENHGYDILVDVLAVLNKNSPLILARTDETDSQRIMIFEGYANAGLRLLQEEMRGVSDYLEDLLRLVGEMRPRVAQPREAGALDIRDLAGDL